MLRSATNINKLKKNFNDARSLLSYSNYLIMKAQLTGNLCFDGHIPSVEELQIAEQCRMLCDNLSHTLDYCKPSEVPDLLEIYEPVYHIGYKRLPDPSFIKKHKHRVFKAWEAGNRHIEESAIYGMLLPEVKFSPITVDKAYSVAFNDIRAKWISTLKKYGRFPEVTTYENYRRLALIMRENLDAELAGNSEQAKREWYELNKIDDLKTVGTQILIAYRRFVATLFPAVLDYEAQQALDATLLHLLPVLV